MNIAVFLGASEVGNPVYTEQARELGAFIAGCGHTLVFGGSDSGLMRLLAEGAKAKGGRIIGVQPEFLHDAVGAVEGLTELIVTSTMAERKQKMLELSDVYIAFPGGTGTLEEIFDALSYVKLNNLRKTIIFLDIAGYYAPLRELFAQMGKEGFAPEETLQQIKFCPSVAELGI